MIFVDVEYYRENEQGNEHWEYCRGGEYNLKGHGQGQLHREGDS